ncbi:hypothetical protein [Cupriavidus necator]|uniref:hypothetical protein n=1 Tax=Cupriavidus necator TaxID=106590 RepID=UPI00339D8677
MTQTWHPITETPETVGLHEYKSKGLVFYVQWDGRHFRWQLSGNVVTPKKGDKWRKEESNVSV